MPDTFVTKMVLLKIKESKGHNIKMSMGVPPIFDHVIQGKGYCLKCLDTVDPAAKSHGHREALGKEDTRRKMLRSGHNCCLVVAKFAFGSYFL